MSPAKSNNQDFYSRNVTVHTTDKKRQAPQSSIFLHRLALGGSQEGTAQPGIIVPLPRSLNERLLPIMDSWTKAEGREERAESGKGLSQGGEKCLKNDILHAKLLHNKNILFQHLINSYSHYEIFKMQWKEGEC